VAATHGGLTARLASWRDVTSARFGRRRLLVATSAAALVAAVPARNALSVATAEVGADGLRRRILESTPSYVGLAEATGRLALPDLPALESTTALLAGVTRVRGYVAGPERWRADELTPVGERDTYRLDGREYVWDFGFDQLTELVGDAALRLPRAADLLPPELGRRLLGLAPDDPVAPLHARRIAGRPAEGVRLTPADPDTTVGRVDVWADAQTGLPLRVEIAARTAPEFPLLVSELQEVDLHAPDGAVLVPPRPPGSARLRSAAADLGGALRVLDAADPPARLAGRPRIRLAGQELPGVGVYGAGLTGFVLVPVSRGIAGRVLDGAGAAGGAPIDVPRGRAVRVATPLLSLAVRGTRGGGVLLVGTVVPEVLERAVVELSGQRT
jgi:hypothetical protein